MRQRGTTAHEIEFALPLISGEWARLRESALLDECGPEILRYAQDDSEAFCHPSLRSGSLPGLGGITSLRLTQAGSRTILRS